MGNIKNFKATIGNIITKGQNIIKTGLSVVMFMICPSLTSYAGNEFLTQGETVTVGNMTDAEKIVGNTLTVICNFGRVAGIFVAVGGVITYIYGYIENNPSTQSKAYPMIAGGIALVGLGTLIKFIFAA